MRVAAVREQGHACRDGIINDILDSHIYSLSMAAI